jgi:hypothetical protein
VGALLTEADGRWFTIALERKFFAPAELAPFARSPDRRSLAAIAGLFLAVGLALFSAYACANADPGHAVVRDRIWAFVGAVAVAVAA